MKIEKVNSRNAIYQKFEVLKSNRNKRYKYQEFLVEGVRNINEAIKNKWEIKSFLYCPDIPLSNWAKGLLNSIKTSTNYELSKLLMDELSGKEDTSELLAIIQMNEDNLENLVFSDNPIIALFDRPSNKGNLGTIIRSCDSLGVEALLITGHSVDLYDPDVITSSMGSFFNMKVIRVPENQKVFDFIKIMKESYPTFQSIGTTAHKEHPLYNINLTKPTMFMIGNETEGLSYAFQEECDLLGTIPMSETSYASSFNVGCAATVMFYEAYRQRYQFNS